MILGGAFCAVGGVSLAGCDFGGRTRYQCFIVGMISATTLSTTTNDALNGVTSWHKTSKEYIVIKNTKQVWEIDQVVSVGFMKNLRVIGYKKTTDWKPDAYLLESTKGVFYEFVPHNGLTRLDSRDQF